MEDLSLSANGAPPGMKPPQPQPTCLPGLSTYHCNQVAPIYREPYIIDGYRKPNPSFAECVAYACVRHNDLCNFWTHFLPLLFWLPWLYYLSHYHDFSHPYYYPLLCFWLGACSYALFSSLAHMFGCKSPLVRSVCYMLDYLGISMYVAGGGIYVFYHQQPLSSPLYDHLFPLIYLHVMACLMATVVCSLSRFFWAGHRFIIRALAFGPAYFCALVPFALRLWVCVSTGEDCIHRTLLYHIFGLFLPVILLFFFVSKIPERFSPGQFDIFFQSHTLFHVFAVALTTLQMYVYPIDSSLRMAALLQKISPSLENVVLPFLVMIAIGLLQVVVLTVLVVHGVLEPNKTDFTANYNQQQLKKEE